MVASIGQQKQAGRSVGISWSSLRGGAKGWHLSPVGGGRGMGWHLLGVLGEWAMGWHFLVVMGGGTIG